MIISYKQIKTKYEVKLSINHMLNNEIKKKSIKYNIHIEKKRKNYEATQKKRGKKTQVDSRNGS